jgi:hypothetical protein
MNPVSMLLDDKIATFRQGFANTSRQLFFRSDGSPIHNGEFGSYREELARTLVAQFAPERMAVDTGFVVTSSGAVSTQCDLVVYDRTATPMIRNASNQRFFPVESVCGVGEVKSVLTLGAAKEALRKLAATKSLRDVLHEPFYVYRNKGSQDDGQYRPETDEKDQIVTFLICEKFSFDIEKNFQELVGCYLEELPHRPFCHRHNMVLSVEDGLLCYLNNQHDGNGYVYPFSSKLTDIEDQDTGEVITRAILQKHRWIQPPKGSNEHIRHFCSMLHTALSVVSVLFPDLARYIPGQEDVQFIDFEQKG